MYWEFFSFFSFFFFSSPGCFGQMKDDKVLVFPGRMLGFSSRPAFPVLPGSFFPICANFKGFFSPSYKTIISVRYLPPYPLYSIHI